MLGASPKSVALLASVIPTRPPGKGQNCVTQPVVRVRDEGLRYVLASCDFLVFCLPFNLIMEISTVLRSQIVFKILCILIVVTLFELHALSRFSNHSS